MKHIQRFFNNDASGGILLIIAAVMAMLMAVDGAYQRPVSCIPETPVQLRVGALEINKNMLLWINDVLMAGLFPPIGLEVSVS
ncbi:Na+/H+ antiporter NhaA [Shigella flexneri]